MAAVTQRIGNYLGGVSRQSDDKKLPGQVRECINGYTDPTFGLVKRPGLEWISTLGSGTTYDSSKWFYIHRDDDEKYIGCIKPAILAITADGTSGATNKFNLATSTSGSGTGMKVNLTASSGKVTGVVISEIGSGYSNSDTITVSSSDAGTGANVTFTLTLGDIDIWNAASGAVCTVTYGTDAQKYLTGLRSNYDVVSVQAASIISNNLVIADKLSVDASDAFVSKAGATLILSDTAIESVYSVTMKSNAGGASDLTFTTATDATATYADLLSSLKNGVESFGVVNRVYKIEVTNKGSGYDSTSPPAVTVSGTAADGALTARTRVENGEITHVVITDHGGTYASNPTITIAAPTSGTTATAVAHRVTDADKIQHLKVTRYAATIEIRSFTNSNFTGVMIPFSISCTGGAAANKLAVFQDQVDNVAQLPIQSFHGRRIKIINTEATTDTYYAKFVADDGSEGPGYWEETIAPGISTGLNSNTMPHELINTALNVFTFGKIPWTARLVGDDTTNNHPGFVGNKIQAAFFHNNRLGFLSKEKVCLSRSAENENFYHTSAQVVTDADPIDISCSTIRPTSLYSVIPTSQGLILFSKNQQFILSSDDKVLTPSSANINSISNYEIDADINPVDMGTNINFISKTPSYTRIFSMETKGQDDNPEVIDIGRVVNEWIPSTIDTLISSPQNQILAMSSQNDDKVYLYRTYSDEDTTLLQSWVNWQLCGNVQTMVLDNDDIYFVTKQNNQFTLSKASISQSPEDAIILNSKGQRVNPCMDLYTTPSSITFNSINNITLVPGSEGVGYSSIPTITITGKTDQLNSGTPGSGATAIVEEISGGKVTKIKITNTGNGYNNGAIATFSGGGATTQATANVSIYNGSRCFLPYNNLPNSTPIIVIKGEPYNNTYTDSGFTITPGVETEKGNDHFTVFNKDLSSTSSNVIIGWKYNLDVTLPRTYFREEDTITDFTASLIVSRMKFAVGLSGVMGFKLKTPGRLEGSKTYTADGRTTVYGWLKSDLSYIYKNEIKVKLNDIVTSDFTVTGDTQITLNSPSSQYATLSGNGSKVFDLTFTPTNPSLIKVEININDVWVEQASNTYRIVKNYIHFDSAPATGSDNIFVYSADTILIYTDEWHSLNPIQKADTYLADDVPLSDLSVFSIPIHQRSENFLLRIVNDSPFPVSLNSMMWEGNYSPRFFRRA